MNEEEFLSCLNQANPRFRTLRSLITTFEPGHYLFAEKGSDLLHVVDHFRQKDKPPIIDKKLHLVIGCFSHIAMLVELYLYHRSVYILPEYCFDLSQEQQDRLAARYIDEGLGCRFSLMDSYNGNALREPQVIASHAYVPDQWDEPLFKKYGIIR